MNWGYKILFVYLAFVVGIMLLVFKSSSQKIDLVTPDYYAKELKYQERIDAVKRADALSSPVSFRIIDQQLVITFPKEFSAATIKGSVLLYYPADNKKDVEQPFSTGDGTFSMQLPANNKGAHELQVSWESEGVSYYFENKLFL